MSAPRSGEDANRLGDPVPTASYPPAGELKGHPFANQFPMIEGREREAFRADLVRHGIREDIVLHEGLVLDGRNRLREGLEAGLIAPDADPLDHPKFREWGSRESDGTSPMEFVISLNLDGRRHLNETQRAHAAAGFETLGHGGKRSPSGSASPDGSATAGQDATLQLDRAGLAQRFNVSPRSIASAKKVREQGAPELNEQVAQGRLAVSVAEKLAALPKSKQREIVATTPADKLKTVAKQVQRQAVEEKLASRQRALPDKLYGVIYADPATAFRTRSPQGMDRSAENHYPTQSIDELKALPVGTLAAPDCALLCWSTSPQLEATLNVIRFWGFKYVCTFIWDKTDPDAPPETEGGLGMGFWGRINHEILILATRGNPPCPAPGTNWSSIHREKKTRHSAKPLHYTLLIESYFPNLPRIELNKRGDETRPGWDYWGNEAPEETPAEPDTAGPAAGVAAEDGGRAHTPHPPSSAPHPRFAYASLVAADTHKGHHTFKTAEPIVRAAYACQPIVPIKDLAAALGHPKGTALTWAHRLKLTSPDRNPSVKHEAAGG